MNRLAQVTLAPANQADNNIALTQTPGSAGNLTLNGAAVASGVATLDMARRVRITSAADDSGKTFTITGTDRYSRAMTEALAGPNTTTTDSINDFLTISNVAISAAAAGAIKVGTGGKVSSQWLPLDRRKEQNVGFGIKVTGTINYTVEHTFEDPFTPGVGMLPNGGLADFALTPYAHAAVTAQTRNRNASYGGIPISAVRVTINSYTNGASLVANFVPGRSGGQSVVGGMTVAATAIPVVTAGSAYTAGNEVGQLLTFTNLFGESGSGIIQSARLRMKSVQTAEFDLYLFGANPTGSTWADKTAPAIVAADAANLIGVLQFGSPNSQLGTETLYVLNGIGKAAAPGAQTIYGVLVTKGTPTFTATSDILGVDLVALQD